MFVNIHFSKYHIWKPLLRASKSLFNNNFARASRFSVHFFAITARLRHESAYDFTFCGRQKKKQDSDFPFLFLNFNSVLRIQLQKNLLVFLKMNIHEHYTNQTYECYPFQPLMSFC